MAMLWLPEATRDPHRAHDLTFTDRGEPKGLLHTTESSSWPSYRGWTVHPHMTVMPYAHSHVTVRQHIDFEHAGFALRNLPGGVQTNRDRVFQIELVGTSSKRGPGYYWPGADDDVLHDLYVKVIRPMNLHLGIPMRAKKFQAYPASYGARRPTWPLPSRGRTNRVRLSGRAWDRYSGWLGHQHAPENVHGDPGAFPWARLAKIAEHLNTPSHPKPGRKTTLGPRLLKMGSTGAQVRAVQRVVKVGADGVFGTHTRAAVEAWQRTHSLHIDGIVGPRTALSMGFTWKD
jgi:peptidoglycan hydrolase-like protein with peptidoglycan-binding domain